jgi:TMEM175 potassium channel family protein
MSRADTQFSKERLEMLCDGIFAIAMTLLVLELKPPDLPRTATTAEILHALAEHGLAFTGFVLSFLLAGQFWILHHVSFNYLRQANRPLAMLTIPFLMFVSLLPFSTSMLTAFGLRNPVGLSFYLGNQFMLAALLATQWLLAKRQDLLIESDGSTKRRRFELLICTQPISFAVATVVVFIAPRQALFAAAMTQIAIALTSRRLAARR